jgi:hypothetical protein
MSKNFRRSSFEIHYHQKRNNNFQPHTLFSSNPNQREQKRKDDAIENKKLHSSSSSMTLEQNKTVSKEELMLEKRQKWRWYDKQVGTNRAFFFDSNGSTLQPQWTEKQETKYVCIVLFFFFCLRGEREREKEDEMVVHKVDRKFSCSGNSFFLHLLFHSYHFFVFFMFLVMEDGCNIQL